MKAKKIYAVGYWSRESTNGPEDKKRRFIYASKDTFTDRDKAETRRHYWQMRIKELTICVEDLTALDPNKLLEAQY